MIQASDSIASPCPVRKRRARVFTPEEEQILRKFIHYNPLTGEFTWKRDVGPYGRHKAGTSAGSINVNKRGHKRWVILIKKIKVHGHRLAFFLNEGRWPLPDMEVDHRDCNALNNKFSNLREATHIENCRNTRASKLSSTQYKGVSLSSCKFRDKRFFARIKLADARYYLGYYHTAIEAHEAYCSAAFFAFGEWANIGNSPLLSTAPSPSESA